MSLLVKWNAPSNRSGTRQSIRNFMFRGRNVLPDRDLCR